MAAIVPKAPHVRTRSTSDPFSDPVYNSQHRMVAAPRPTTSGQTPNKPSSRSAVPASDSRAKMHRSQTAAVPTSQDAYAPQQAKRTVSQDSIVRAAASHEKSKHGGRRGKKGSVHADVIDRLDFSGVGPMFHHDGPFDACAPSRNKNLNKAPMKAWGADYAAQDEQALARARQMEPARSPRGEKTSYTTSPVIPYEAPKKAHDALAEAWGIHEPEPFEEFSAGGGMHSRGSTRHNTPVATNFTSAPPGRRSREQAPPPSSAGAANAASRQARREKRAQLPPPQPIFVDDGEHFANGAPEEPDSAPNSPTRPGAPKRSKSLMQRIRKMRDNPNVPAGSAQDDYIESDTAAIPEVERPSRSARPTHRTQLSFMGRGAPAPAPITTSASYDDSRSPRSEKEDQFVYIEKDLPSAPGARSPGENAYFDESYNGVGGGSGNGATGLGRKTSLMKRAKGLMRGGK